MCGRGRGHRTRLAEVVSCTYAMNIPITEIVHFNVLLYSTDNVFGDVEATGSFCHAISFRNMP